MSNKQLWRIVLCHKDGHWKIETGKSHDLPGETYKMWTRFGKTGLLDYYGVTDGDPDKTRELVNKLKDKCIKDMLQKCERLMIQAQEVEELHLEDQP